MATPSVTWVKHPGYYIKEEMEERGWSQRDLAFILGVSEQAINPILNGKRGISPEMAKVLGEGFDVPAEFFANLQQAYDLAQARTPDTSVALRRTMQSTYDFSCSKRMAVSRSAISQINQCTGLF